MFVRLRSSQAYIPDSCRFLVSLREKWKLIENLDLCCPCQRKRKRVERGREYAPWKVRITAKAARWRQAKTRRSSATARRRNVSFLCKETADRGLNGHFEAETPCQVKLKNQYNFWFSLLSSYSLIKLTVQERVLPPTQLSLKHTICAWLTRPFFPHNP